MRFGKRIRIKEIVKGVWAFCSYLFVPQWGRRKGNERVERGAEADVCSDGAAAAGDASKGRIQDVLLSFL
jgi:hypothetical protein